MFQISQYPVNVKIVNDTIIKNHAMEYLLHQTRLISSTVTSPAGLTSEKLHQFWGVPGLVSILHQDYIRLVSAAFLN